MEDGERKGSGLEIVNGIVINVLHRQPGTECTCVVVPRCRRQEVLDVAQKGLEAIFHMVE